MSLNKTLVEKIYSEFYSEDLSFIESSVRFFVQKMIFLLMEKGYIYCEYNFIWHTQGPYSLSLQNELIDIAKKSDKENDTTGLDENLLINIKTMGNRILTIPTDSKYDKTNWIETIASLAYLKNHVNTSYSKKEAIAKLMFNKPHLSHIETNNAAWDVLSELKII